MNTADVWARLSLEDRALLLRLTMPSMRQAPRLLALRATAREAELANRCILGASGQRWAFARYLIASGRLTDG